MKWFCWDPANDYTFNIAINHFCRLNRTDLGYVILGTFIKSDFQLDVTTFTTLLNGLIQRDRFSDAKCLFKKLILAKICEPNEVSYNTMIKRL